MPLVHGKCCIKACCFSHLPGSSKNGTDNRTMHTLGAQLLLLVREQSTQITFPSMNVSLPNTSNLWCVKRGACGKVFCFPLMAKEKKHTHQKPMDIILLFIQCEVQSSPSPILYLIWFIYVVVYLSSKSIIIEKYEKYLSR